MTGRATLVVFGWIALDVALVVAAEPSPPSAKTGPQDSVIKALLAREIVGKTLPLAEVQTFCEARVPPMPKVSSVAQWESQAAAMRAGMFERVVFCGEAAKWRDAATKVEWLDTIPGGPGYRIKKFRYEALPGLWIPGLLYEPEKLAGKVPVILNVNGHVGGPGKAYVPKQIRSINQAKRGMLALNVEWIGMGQLGTAGFNHYRANQLDLCGTSGVAPHYLAMKRAIDILLSLPNADPSRVAVTGLSGGGWQTIFISGLDTRVTLANPVAGYSSYRTRARNLSDLGDSEQSPNDMATVADYCHLTAMRAPHATLLTKNAKDDCCFASAHSLPPLLEAAKPIYKLYGRESALRSHVNDVPGTHNYEIDNRQAFYRMLGDSFYPGAKDFNPKEIPSDAEVKTKEQLEVPLPAKNEDFHTLALALSRNLPRDPELPKDKATTVPWQKTRCARLADLVRARQYDAKAIRFAGEERDGVKATFWKLSMGGAWTVPAVELVKGDPRQTAILVADGGRASATAEVERLLATGYRVVAMDPFYFGESRISARDYLFALLVAAVGERPLGLQASQVAAASRWSSVEHKTGPVHLVALGPRSSTFALVAAALEERAIGSVEIHDPTTSLKQLIEQNASVEQNPELFCFGLLEAMDVKQIAALVAPRPVRFLKAADRARSDVAGLEGLYRVLGSTFSPIPAAETPAKALVKRAGTEISLGNQSIELVFEASEKRCAAVRLVNEVSGRTIPIRSDDFSIGLEGRAPLRVSDFKFKAARDEATAAGQRLTLHLESASGAQLAIVYELGDRDSFLRRRLELTTKSPLPLRQADVWLAGIDGTCSHQGFGSPVLLEDTFWGVEFPAAENRYADGVAKLSHFPGRTVSDRFTSKTAVLGVSEPGRAARHFQRYVESFRAPSSKTPLFVNYNTWWTLMPPTEENSLELIELFRRKLHQPYGESIDTFTLDDGWDVDESLWDIDAKAFPRGFTPLVEALKAQKARLGIWLSPSSGYNHAPWLAKHGYQANSNAWYVCSSDPNYRRDIVKRVTELAKQNNVAFFKFDGFSAACDAPGHAHLPGPYAREANVDAFIELMSAVRRVQPEVYLDPTCGMWLSPWWLQYADSLWGNVSGDYPDIIVPAPIVRDSATTTRDAVFRQRCQEHPGYPPAAIEHLGVIVITPEKWEDNAMIVVGRGARLLTLYVDPKHFRHGDRDWAFMGALLKWTRHNADLLRHTELILGDPMKREPYGYAHFRETRGILALRNPFIEPKTVQIKLDESLGWSPEKVPAPFSARIVYPRQEVLAQALKYGDTLSLQLQAYETMIVEVLPPSRVVPLLPGLRYEEERREGNRVTFSIYGYPGQKTSVPLAAEKATFDGRPLPFDRTPHGSALTLAWPGPEQYSAARGAKLESRSSDRRWEITGKCTVETPIGSKATMHVLCDPRGTRPGVIQCMATVGGKPVEVRAVRTPSKPEQAHTPHLWTWFEFSVPDGRSEVALTVSPAEKTDFFRGEVGWWLWTEHPLKKSTLVVEFAGAIPKESAAPLPLPVGMQSQRVILTIQPPKLMRIGDRWPKDKPLVWLDVVEPDEAAQDYGKVEKNRSVWQKPMIVAGKKFARGLGVHANGRILYELAGAGFKTFRCQVGRDEHAGDGNVVFQVWADGKKLFDSGPMTKITPAKPVEVNVAGASTLDLRALDGGDGIAGDHANWAEAQLLR